MTHYKDIVTRMGLTAALVLILAGCQTPISLRPFTTDGCSMFPDRALIGNTDWCACCLAHDLAYWQGGTAAERLAADRELAQCVTKSAHSPALATMMLSGVRIGGSPYLPTSYRWGYGWSYGRLYQPLTDHEQAEATALRAAYVDGNPNLVCTGSITDVETLEGN